MIIKALAIVYINDAEFDSAGKNENPSCTVLPEDFYRDCRLYAVPVRLVSNCRFFPGENGMQA